MYGFDGQTGFLPLSLRVFPTPQLLDRPGADQKRIQKISNKPPYHTRKGLKPFLLFFPFVYVGGKKGNKEGGGRGGEGGKSKYGWELNLMVMSGGQIRVPVDLFPSINTRSLNPTRRCAGGDI